MMGMGGVGGLGARNLQHALDVANEQPSIDALELSEPHEVLDVPRGSRPPTIGVRLWRALSRRRA